MGGYLKKRSYQFISKFDTFRHKFHCHITFNVLHLFKYSIYLFFRNFKGGFIRGKLNYHKYSKFVRSNTVPYVSHAQ